MIGLDFRFTDMQIKQRTEQKQKAAKFGKPVLKQQSGQNVEKGKKNAKKSMCPVMRQCGGCQMLDMPYAEQLKTKRKRLETLLKGICPVKDMIGMEDPFYYRNKVHAVFDRDRRGNIISGIYQENTHNVVPVEKCMIEDQKADEIIGTIRGMLKSFKIRIFDEDTGYGLLRHVLIRKGFHSGELMVCLVINGKDIPLKEQLVEELCRIKGMTSISYSINREKTNVIMGKEIVNLYGPGYITDSISDVTYQISPLSFYQVNPVQTEKLYGTALEYAGLTGNETVWDLYCGIGTISLFLAQNAKKVYGVEIVPQAIEDARRNAALNHITNAEFFTGKAEEVLPEQYAKNKVYADVIVVDPPRKGCDQVCLDTILKMAPKRVVYVSCDSSTLARDLRYLADGGYEVEKVRCCDMFGQSCHVETVVFLSKH